MRICKYALLQIRIIVTQTVHLWALPTLNSVSQLSTLTLKTESEHNCGLGSPDVYRPSNINSIQNKVYWKFHESSLKTTIIQYA